MIESINAFFIHEAFYILRVWEEDFYFAFVFGIVHREKLVMLIEESPCIKGENFYRDIVFEDNDRDRKSVVRERV